MSFETIQPRESTVDACARALRTAIMRGELAPGARLPPERQLAASFGVNRVTVRSALAQLAKERMLSVRQGRGYLVHDFQRAGGPELLPDLTSLARERGELATVVGDMLLVRRHLARALLQRIAERPVDGSGVFAAVDRLEALVSQGCSIDAIAEADLAAVAELLDVAASPVLRLCMNPVTRAVTQLPELREVIYAEPVSNVAGWRLLCIWLEHCRAEDVAEILSVLEAHDRAAVERLTVRSPG